MTSKHSSRITSGKSLSSGNVGQKKCRGNGKCESEWHRKLEKRQNVRQRSTPTKKLGRNSSGMRKLGEEFALGNDPKSLHATVLMRTVYNAVIQHSEGFLKHVAISVIEKAKITAV